MNPAPAIAAGFHACFSVPVRMLQLAAGLMLAAPLAAQTVAITHFAHVELERNHPGTTAGNVDLILSRLAPSCPYTFVERAQLESLLAERALQAAGATTNQGGAETPRLAQVDLFLTGTIFSPPDRQAYVVLEVVEAARAEVTARAEVNLSATLHQSMLMPLSDADAATICEAAKPLLQRAAAELEARPRQILVKFLGLPNLTQSIHVRRTVNDKGHVVAEEQYPKDPNPVYNRVGDQIEAELARRTEHSGTHRILRTDRPDAAVDESELRLLGLVESDYAAWETFADYYVWGVCDESLTLHLWMWDGDAPLRELRFALPSEPASLPALVGAAADAILEASTHPTRMARATADPGQRERVAQIVRELAHQLGDPPRSVRMAKRLAAAAVFLDPDSSANWVELGKHHKARTFHDDDTEVISRLRARSRSVVDSGGRIQTDALFLEPASYVRGLSPLSWLDTRLTHKQSTDLPSANAHKLIRDATQRESLHAARRLALAAPGQHDAFLLAATSILADVFQPSLPWHCYSPDPKTADEVIQLLLPRLKVAAAVNDAWNDEPLSPAHYLNDAREWIADYLFLTGRAELARQVAILNAEELAAALAAPPPARSRTGQELARKLNEEKTGLRTTYDPRTTEKRKQAEICRRRRAELYLRACSTEPPETVAALKVLEEGPAGLLRLDAAAHAASGNLPELKEALATDNLGAVSGRALVGALRARNWLVVEYLLQGRLEERVPSWKISGSDIGSPLSSSTFAQDYETLDAIALAEAVVRRRFDVADRLVAGGVRFDRQRSLGAYALEHSIRRGDLDGVRRLVAAGALSSGGASQRSGLAASFALMIRNRDLAMLEVLLENGLNVHEVAVGGFALLGDPPPELVAQGLVPMDVLALAAAANWHDGIVRLLNAPTFKWEKLTVDARTQVYHYSTDPRTRALLVRESLRAAYRNAEAQAATGIDLVCAIVANDLVGVKEAWSAPAARTIRLQGLPPLSIAVKEGAVEIARWLVANGARVEEYDDEKLSPLAHAVSRGNVELVRLLVRGGANVDETSAPGRTHLLRAIRARHEPVALALIDLGCTITGAPQFRDSTPLLQAAQYGLVPVVDRLLARGANPRATDGGSDLLAHAVLSDSPELIDRAVRLGCDSSAYTEGKSLLATAAYWGAANSVRKLLALGLRDPAARQYAAKAVQTGMDDQQARGNRWVKNPDHRTCLRLLDAERPPQPSDLKQRREQWNRSFVDSIPGRSTAELEAFARAGGDLVSTRMSLDQGPVPLQNAVLRGDLDHVRTLLRLGANPDGMPPGKQEFSHRNIPLCAALYQDEPLARELVDALLQHGATTQIRAPAEYDSLLALAFRTGSSAKTISLLLASGAEIDARAVAAFPKFCRTWPTRLGELTALVSEQQLRALKGDTSASGS